MPPDLAQGIGSGMGQGMNQGFEPGLRPATEFRNLNQSSMNDFGSDQNSQLIIAKLDLIISKLQNLEQRVALIEQIAKDSQEPDKKWTPRRTY
jgi:hypothetical protein